MIAFVDYQGSIHECGHPLDETTSIEADRDNINGEYYYEAGLPIRCHACTAIARKQKEYPEHDSARLWVANRIERD